MTVSTTEPSVSPTLTAGVVEMRGAVIDNAGVRSITAVSASAQAGANSATAAQGSHAAVRVHAATANRREARSLEVEEGPPATGGEDPGGRRDPHALNRGMVRPGGHSSDLSCLCRAHCPPPTRTQARGQLSPVKRGVLFQRLEGEFLRDPFRVSTSWTAWRVRSNASCELVGTLQFIDSTGAETFAPSALNGRRPAGKQPATPAFLQLLHTFRVQCIASSG